MDIEILDICKENIQPLKRGRKASQLGLALQAEVNTELQEKLAKERGELELAIISYDGPDPLQPRIEYVEWMEQTHIKHGKDCNLIPLLEDTITLFKDNPEYKQDTRFIELIVKYIEVQENAVELFQMVYSQGLGTMCAVLYRAWADILDQAQDYKRADQVYLLGIANHAQPLDMLKEAHAQFQLSIGRRMMLSGGELPKPLIEEPPRQVLGKLKKDVGSVRRAQGAAGILTLRQNVSTSKQLSVFQDPETNYDHLISIAIQKSKLSSIASSEKNNEENVIKAGKWNKGYNKREVGRLPSMPSTPSFTVHADPEAESEGPKFPPKTPSNVLKTRKADLASSNAMEVFSSSHSARKALQSNLELYSGGTEFSFEELRLAYLQRRSQKNELFQTPMRTPKIAAVTDYSNMPLQPRNLTLCEEKGYGCQDEIDNDNCDERTACQTPLKRVGFMPLTPSAEGVDLTDFEETPVQMKSKKKPSSFSIYTEEVSNSSENQITAKNEVLPTIDESDEMGGNVCYVIKKASNFETRKVITTENKTGKNEFIIFNDND